MSKSTGGPAFPVHDPFSAHQPGTVSAAQRLAEGMTMRDYFAAKAMQGFISSGSDSFHSHGFDYSDACGDDTTPHDEYATAAYRLADAMLKAREP